MPDTGPPGGSPTRERFYSVDALRGLAAFAVCVFHLGYTFAPHVSLLKHGWLGVRAFFVISGFVIPYSLSTSYRLRDYRRFLLKRIIRLDPPYIVSIVITLLLGFLASRLGTGAQFHVNMTNVLLHFGYLNAFVGQEWLTKPYWSLAIEFQYYLSIGLIFGLLIHRLPAVRWAALTCIAALGCLRVPERFLPAWLLFFAVGILLFQYRAGLVTKGQLWLGFVVLSVAIGLHNTILDVLTASLTVAAILSERTIRWKFAPLAFLGQISYSLYLLHVPVGGKIMHLAASASPLIQWIAFPVSTVTALVAAYLLYRFVERPSQRLSSRISMRRPVEGPNGTLEAGELSSNVASLGTLD